MPIRVTKMRMPTLRTRALLPATVAWLPVPAIAAPAGVANAPGATQSMLHDGLTRAYLVRAPRGLAMRRRVDDVGFIGALIDKLSIDYPVDPKRIYATGMSNGGMMTHRLGIELADRVAAIAPVVATVFGDEREPTRPVPALMINGMLDKSVPFRGGRAGEARV